MPYSDNAKSVMLSQLGTVSVFASLHSAFPGQAGASEISGGSPAYARKAITWNAPSAGAMTNATNPTFDVPGSTTIQWLGLWGLITGGTFYGSAPLGSGIPVPFTVDDLTNDVLQAEAHGFTNGQQIVMIDTQGAILPAGVTEGTPYFVVQATTNSFKVSTTSGGSAVDLTGRGAGFAAAIVPETFGSQGTFTTSSVNLSLAA